MSIEQLITQQVKTAVEKLYQLSVSDNDIQLQKTKPAFEGNLTVVVFPFVKAARKAPQQVAQEIGEAMISTEEGRNIIDRFNAVQGFLNLVISNRCWLNCLQQIASAHDFGKQPANGKLMMVEYSSPNTNKPLHLGHVRNNLLGYSIAQIQEANGWKVVKTNIVNDRGIHICKSMLAWQLFGNGETPESSGKKGDHLIGDYYVRFDIEYKKQIRALVEGGMDEETAKKEAPLMKQAQAMLLRWEQGDEEVRKLWEMMNSWVYAGFDETYRNMGVSFDKIYYESNTYLEGKKEVERGLQEGKFYRREDNSVWADLTKDGLDEKLLLRQDGTSVYMTQDIGTAKLRYQDYPIDKMVYVVGNEQEYHFKVLSILLDRLGFPFGKDIVHFSYGMVELPNGKMKSREGTVVDADELMEQMIEDAKQVSKDKVQKLTGISAVEADEIARKVGLGALKYFILKVDPRKNMLFNPEESIDFNGNTGPFIQYTYARIMSVLRKNEEIATLTDTATINDKEITLIQLLADYPQVVKQAGDEFSPALIANYAYQVASEFNSFYHDYSILSEQNEQIRHLRIMLAQTVGNVLKSAMTLLGIEMPERM
ncbi:MAG: arginine--tRNA ligase [Paludibacteraceae bacterium]|nr:arginine--tRNA ligase [Paludibacteraceae bacterium]